VLKRWDLEHLGHKLVAPSREKQRQLPADVRHLIHECKNCGWLFLVTATANTMPYGEALTASETDLREREPCPGPIPETDRGLLMSLSLSAASEISKAFKRLGEGDNSGAISSACGAVDLSTTSIYRSHGKAEPKEEGFAVKVREATRLAAVFESLERELQVLAMRPDGIKFVRENLKTAISSSAEVLGRLRRTMGDVHGSKPALSATVRTCIKLASAVSGLLDGTG